ncbi:MAG: coiled-coil domain-containing protein, partial [Planctomycetota bacterium]
RNDDVARLESDLAAANERMRAAEEAGEANAAALRTALATAGENEAAAEEAFEAQQAGAAALADLTVRTHALQEREVELTELIESMRGELAASIDEIRSRDESIEQRDAEARTAADEIAAIEATLAEAVESLESERESARGLGGERDALQESVERLSVSARGRLGELATLRGQLETESGRCAELQERLAIAEETVDQLDRERVTLAQTISEQIMQADELGRSVEDANERIASLEAEAEDRVLRTTAAEQALAEREGERDELRGELEAARTMLAEAQDAIANGEERCRVAVAELEVLRSELDDARRAAEASTERDERTLRAIESERDDLLADVETRQVEEQRLRKGLDELVEAHAVLEGEKADLLEEIEAAAAHVEQLLGKETDDRVALERAVRRAEAAEAQLEQVRREAEAGLDMERGTESQADDLRVSARRLKDKNREIVGKLATVQPRVDAAMAERDSAFEQMREAQRLHEEAREAVSEALGRATNVEAECAMRDRRITALEDERDRLMLVEEGLRRQLEALGGEESCVTLSAGPSTTTNVSASRPRAGRTEHDRSRGDFEPPRAQRIRQLEATLAERDADLATVLARLTEIEGGGESADITVSTGLSKRLRGAFGRRSRS